MLGSIENVFSHTRVLPNIEGIFSAKSFRLGNISLLTNFQKLFAVCRNGQLIWLGGHFEKAADSG